MAKAKLKKFEVTYSVEVVASTPERAAIIARDMMLDPDTALAVDVVPYEWFEEFDVSEFNNAHGWLVQFGRALQVIDLAPWRKIKLGS